jgi:enamine deaminase RidA (YjgF/YER057c/UK114 family)
VTNRSAVNPWQWSIPFGFNQAELVENPSKVLVCSGQTALDPDGHVQHAGDMAGQVDLALDNLAEVLAAAGMTMDNVVRITAFTTDVDAFLQSGLGGEKRPMSAMTLIGVSRLAYPELLVELEAIAVA